MASTPYGTYSDVFGQHRLVDEYGLWAYDPDLTLSDDERFTQSERSINSAIDVINGFLSAFGLVLWRDGQIDLSLDAAFDRFPEAHTLRRAVLLFDIEVSAARAARAPHAPPSRSS